MSTFSVHYGPPVKLMTLVAGGLLLGTAVYGLWNRQHGMACVLGMTVLPLSLLVGSALFTVLGYRISEHGIHVLRPIGRKLIAPNAVDSITVDERALKGAIRTFGNGGLFSLNGWFHLPGYGRSRLWVTNTRDLVVIRYGNKTVVVSPDDPAAFVSRVESLRKPRVGEPATARPADQEALAQRTTTR